MKIQITKEDVVKINRVMSDFGWEQLIYTLKDGKFVIDSGITSLPSPITDQIEYISEAEARRLIEDFQKRREESSCEWPNPTEILDPI